MMMMMMMMMMIMMMMMMKSTSGCSHLRALKSSLHRLKCLMKPACILTMKPACILTMKPACILTMKPACNQPVSLRLRLYLHYYYFGPTLFFMNTFLKWYLRDIMLSFGG